MLRGLKAVSFLAMLCNVDARKSSLLTQWQQKKQPVTGEVFFSDNKIYGAGVGGSQSSMDCQKVPENYKQSSTEPRIKVCGTNLKVTLYLWNDCAAGSAKPLEIGSCDSSKPASTCEEFAPGSDGAPLGMQHFLSYQISNCEA